MNAAILVGDFNLAPKDPAISWIKDFGFHLLINNHVDYIFSLGPVNSNSVSVIDLKSDNTSDHNGLWLDLGGEPRAMVKN